MKNAKRTDHPALPADFVAVEAERCPECGHMWNDVGPAHFADCRFFCLDDDRDEEPAAVPVGWGYLPGDAV